LAGFKKTKIKNGDVNGDVVVVAAAVLSIGNVKVNRY